MDKQLLDEVIACLPEGRTFFHYHRDRYVLLLLEELARRGNVQRVGELKQTPYAHWLQKGFVKEWLAAQGRADVPVQDLLLHWPTGLTHFTYLLSLGAWGQDKRNDWRQTSRPGWNLVLHLNLPLQHQRNLRDIGVADPNRLQGYGHPRARNRLTLAWARIDLDWQTGEALIEEIQSDWMRDIARLRDHGLRLRAAGRTVMRWRGRDIGIADLLDYAQLLMPHAKVWHEAMLSATLWFLWRELGLHRVYYHSWQTGNVLKQLDSDWAPPRSLYSELPERFGFRRVDAGPAFLEGHHCVRRLKAKQQRQRKPLEWSWYHWAA